MTFTVLLRSSAKHLIRSVHPKQPICSCLILQSRDKSYRSVEWEHRITKPAYSKQSHNKNRNKFRYAQHETDDNDSQYTKWEKDVMKTADRFNELDPHYGKKYSGNKSTLEIDRNRIKDYKVESDSSPDLIELEQRFAHKRYEDSSTNVRKYDTRKQKRYDGDRFDNHGLDGRSKVKRSGYASNLPSIKGEVVFGLFPSLLAIQNRHEVSSVYIKDSMREKGGTIQHIIQAAEENKAEVLFVPIRVLDALSRGRPHQGVCVDVSRKKADVISTVNELQRKSDPQISVFLDAVQDPMNFGAVLRGAYYMGIDHVVTGVQNSCPLSPVVSKASAGAMELTNIYSTKDAVQFLQSCSSSGWQVLGTVGHKYEGGRVTPLSDVSVQQNTIVIIGNEGRGLSDEMLELCDVLVTIPGAHSLNPAVDSLNVSVASGIIFHHLTSNKTSSTENTSKDSQLAHPREQPSDLAHPTNQTSDITSVRKTSSEITPAPKLISAVSHPSTNPSDLVHPSDKTSDLIHPPKSTSDIIQPPTFPSDIINPKPCPSEVSKHQEEESHLTFPKRQRSDIILSTEDNDETSISDVEEIKDYITSQTEVSHYHLTPEIGLHLVTPACDLWWGRGEDCPLPDPFWAFYWPGGQALTRYILDNPQLVRGKRVLDVGSGCGASAIAASMCGAQSVCANDICQVAITAIQMNAEINQVYNMEFSTDNFIGQELNQWDIILLGDMFYDQEFTNKVSDWLLKLSKSGKMVLIGDPGRVYFMDHPIKSKLCEVGCYEMNKQSREENNGLTHAKVWTFEKQFD